MKGWKKKRCMARNKEKTILFKRFFKKIKVLSEKSAAHDQAATGIFSEGGGTIIPVFWISVWEGSS